MLSLTAHLHWFQSIAAWTKVCRKHSVERVCYNLMIVCLSLSVSLSFPSVQTNCMNAFSHVPFRMTFLIFCTCSHFVHPSVLPQKYLFLSCSLSVPIAGSNFSPLLNSCNTVCIFLWYCTPGLRFSLDLQLASCLTLGKFQLPGPNSSSVKWK